MTDMCTPYLKSLQLRRFNYATTINPCQPCWRKTQAGLQQWIPTAKESPESSKNKRWLWSLPCQKRDRNITQTQNSPDSVPRQELGDPYKDESFSEVRGLQALPKILPRANTNKTRHGIGAHFNDDSFPLAHDPPREVCTVEQTQFQITINALVDAPYVILRSQTRQGLARDSHFVQLATLSPKKKRGSAVKQEQTKRKRFVCHLKQEFQSFNR